MTRRMRGLLGHAESIDLGVVTGPGVEIDPIHHYKEPPLMPRTLTEHCLNCNAQIADDQSDVITEDEFGIHILDQAMYDRWRNTVNITYDMLLVGDYDFMFDPVPSPNVLDDTRYSWCDTNCFAHWIAQRITAQLYARKGQGL